VRAADQELLACRGLSLNLESWELLRSRLRE
jgi:hypothetical protein